MRTLDHLRLRAGAMRGPKPPTTTAACGKEDTSKLCSCPRTTLCSQRGQVAPHDRIGPDLSHSEPNSHTGV